MITRRLLAALLLGGGSAVGVLAVGSAAGATGPAQIRITDVETKARLVHPIGGGWGGATEVIAQQLYNPSISGRPIGRSQIVCTYVDSRNRTCLGTYQLPKGDIVVGGALQTRLLYEVPIVGGTGLYDNARGTVTVTATKFRPRREVLVFRLLG